MKLITPRKLLDTLREGRSRVEVPTEVADRARAALEAMISIGPTGSGQ
jgi:quinolinate synthase